MADERKGEFSPYEQPTRHVREETETGKWKRGCRGCGCLFVLWIGICSLIALPQFADRQKIRELVEIDYRSGQIRGVCRSGVVDPPLRTAVIGEVTYAGFSPVWGCGRRATYRRLAKIEWRHYRRMQAGDDLAAGRDDRERFKRLFDDYAAKGECRAMPAGAQVVVTECSVDPDAKYIAQVRLEGEDAVWQVPCSGLKAP